MFDNFWIANIVGGTPRRNRHHVQLRVGAVGHVNGGGAGQTSPLNVRRIGGVTMAENHSSTRAPKTRKPHRCQADEDLVARFICHANSTHVLQSLWRGLVRASSASLEPSVASRTLVGKMLISSPPFFGGEEMRYPSPRCYYTQRDQEPSGRLVRPVARTLRARRAGPIARVSIVSRL